VRLADAGLRERLRAVDGPGFDAPDPDPDPDPDPAAPRVGAVAFVAGLAGGREAADSAASSGWDGAVAGFTAPARLRRRGAFFGVVRSSSLMRLSSCGGH
jgi:hypothetical protein